MGAALMRVENWPTKLVDFIESRRHEPFAWGQNDCSLFVADALIEITGTDYAAPFRGEYSTAIGSFRALKAAGFDSVLEYLTATFGEPCHKNQLSRGDVGLFESPTGPTVAICIGAIFVATGEAGLVFIPFEQIIVGWQSWQ